MSLSTITLDIPIIEVDEPWFDYLVSGEKKCEGRKASSKGKQLMKQVAERRLIIIENKNGKQALFKVTNIRYYYNSRPRDKHEDLESYVRSASSLAQCLMFEGIRNMLPGVQSFDEAIDVYRGFSSDKELATHDFLAIEMSFVHYLDVL